jgi:hypothetical protein
MKTKHQLIHNVALVCLIAGIGASAPTIRAENTPAKEKAQLPFTIYDEKGGTNNHYVASGWMGNTKGLKMDEGCTNNPHGGKTCFRFEYSEAGDWAGIVWQDPANDWGDQPGGWNLDGAKKLTFWARGDKGGETVTFKFGVLGPDKKYADSMTGESGALKLTSNWTEYNIDLAGKDMTRIKTGFVWSLTGQGSPVVFYLDDIRFE